MTICHGIPWYRNVADNYCPFSIEGWWLFLYPLSYLTLTKLRKAGYTIPDSKSKSEGAVVVQDVVKVNLVSEDMSGSVIEQNTRPLTASSTPSVAAELVVGNVTLRLFNGADQNLIRCAMQCMGGATRAW